MPAHLTLQVAPRAPAALLRQLEQRFLRLAQTLPLPTMAQRVLWQDLQRAYEQPHRPYHNLVHLSNMLVLLDQQGDAVADPTAFEWAVWYHDLVYDVARADNEAQSAQRMTECLQGHLPQVQLQRIQGHILATAGHKIRTNDPDEPLFLDVDLSILAAAPTVEQQYRIAIAQEYGTLYPPAIYQIGRQKVLANFLQRDQLFLTSGFRAPYEATARANLKHELHSLQP